MLLDTTTRKLQLVLTAAMTTANMPVCVYFVDTNDSDFPTSGMSPTTSNGTSVVDILAAPVTLTQRKINSLTVNNIDTAAKTVQIYLDDNGTDYLLCAATLQVGDVLGYTDTRGWYVNDSAGNLKVTPTNAISASLVTNTPAGNISATTAQAAINELDTEKMALATYDPDGDGVVDTAEAIVMLCRNNTGVTISKMVAVYITGATGQSPTIALAKADAEATSSKTIGVVTADIANNATGLVAMLGEIHDYNTSAFADGDTLWLSATTAGAFTATRPTAPNHAVLIGFVAYSHASNGKIALNITNGQELDELHNVLITSVANNELLQYDSASLTWKNRSTLAGLTLTSPVINGIVTTTGLTLPAHSINGVLTLAAGTVSAPSAEWDSGDGIYKIGAHNLGLAIAGTKLLDMSSGVFGVSGELTAGAINASGDFTGKPAVSNAARVRVGIVGNATTYAALSLNDNVSTYEGVLGLMGRINSGEALYINAPTGYHVWQTINGITVSDVSSTGLAVTGTLSADQLNLPKTITAAGTTGAQTINKPTGSVNFAAAATSLVVTNSLVGVNSIINCTVASNDATMKSVAVVAASGSFTIYPNAVPTAETRVDFRITN